MHSIRRRAHATAWQSAGQSSAFNPYSRREYRSERRDEEAEAAEESRLEQEIHRPGGALLTTDQVRAIASNPNNVIEVDQPMQVTRSTADAAATERSHDPISMRPMQIFVKTLRAETITLSIMPSDTIGDMKQMIQRRTEVPPPQQRLVLGGQQLEDHRTVGSYNITSQSTIHMVTRLCGGGRDDKDADDADDDLHPEQADQREAEVNRLITLVQGYGGTIVAMAKDAVDEDPPPEKGRWRLIIRKKSESVSLTVPKKSEKRSLTVNSQLRLLFYGSWSHLLLLFIPVGFAMNYAGLNPAVVFAMNFVAIVPSAFMLGVLVDELTLRTGEVVGGILNMTFGNAVQLITSAFLLRSRQVSVLQTSLIGSILSNLLLMTGLAFSVGGYNRIEQNFNIVVAQTLNTLLLLIVMSLMIPTAARFFAETNDAGIRNISRGTAVLLILSYGLWMLYQLKTHARMFDPEFVPRRAQHPPRSAAFATKDTGTEPNPHRVDQYSIDDEDEDDECEPRLSLPAIAIGLAIYITLLAFNAQFAADSVQGLLQSAGLSSTFVGLVILPLLGNDPATLMVAYRDKMDLSIALTVGKCIQTALLIVPLTIMMAWGMGVEEMTLLFSGFEIAALFAAVLVVSHVVGEGRSDWLRGALLVDAFILLALASYFVP